MARKGLPTNGNKDILKRRCTDNGIALTEIRTSKSIKGWKDTAKGGFQVAYERGHIDGKVPRNKLNTRYTDKGRKGNNGMLLPGTAWKDIIASLPDFQNEKTLLQYHAEKRGTVDCKILFDRSPKCHPEIAGEGIEYDWGGIKMYYRRAKLKEKRTAKNFRLLVMESLETVKFNHRTSFSSRAREYMLAYDVLADWKDKEGDEKLPEQSAKMLNQIVKCRRKSHRDVGNDAKYVSMVMKRNEAKTSKVGKEGGSN